MSSSMMRGLPLNNSRFKIVNVSSIIMENKSTTKEINDSDDDSDKDALHIEETIEIDDSESDEPQPMDLTSPARARSILNSREDINRPTVFNNRNATASFIRTPFLSSHKDIAHHSVKQQLPMLSLINPRQYQGPRKKITTIEMDDSTINATEPSNLIPWNVIKKIPATETYTLNQATGLLLLPIPAISLNAAPKQSFEVWKNPKPFEQADYGHSPVVQNDDITASLPTCSINCIPATVEESFTYQCEFCLENFSTDQLLIDHCARMHTKDVKCKYCKKTFYREKDLHFHMRTHIKKGKAYKCQTCTGVFMKLAELREHEKMHDLDNGVSYECDICERSMPSMKSLQEHKRRFLHKQCEVCLEYFSSQTTLLQHFSVHIKQKTGKYSCDQCDGIFGTKILLKKHRSKHRLYECELCSTKFRRKVDIKCHLKMDCSKRNLYQCTACKKSFLSETNWKEHVDTHFNRNRCEFCLKKIFHSVQLSEHLENHDDIEHPYKCKLCFATLLSKRIFNFHLKTHVDQTKFKCEYCCRWFRSRNQLDKHSIIHTNDTYNCSLCEMRFPDAVRLDQHVKSHSGRDFQCDICKRSYCSRDSILGHMTDTHFPMKKCHICEKEFKNQHRLITHLKSHYVKVVLSDEEVI